MGVSSTLFGGAVPSGHHCDASEMTGGAARSHRSRDESAGEQWSEQAVLFGHKRVHMATRDSMATNRACTAATVEPYSPVRLPGRISLPSGEHGRERSVLWGVP